MISPLMLILSSYIYTSMSRLDSGICQVTHDQWINMWQINELIYNDHYCIMIIVVYTAGDNCM